MIETEILEQKLGRYAYFCLRRRRRPTFCGLGVVLGCSGKTISNVVRGSFNGKSYTDRPSCTRIIGNDDFDLIQGLFVTLSDQKLTQKTAI